MHCYKRAELAFRDVIAVAWTNQNISGSISMDEDGQDLGTVDTFTVNADVYRLQGDFGMLEVRSSSPELIVLE
ncbi:hypothetical protein GCM10008960_03750 [Deinococcus sedimenti]|uniref:PRC-barrel domain-containing protein n=2 Tax=Deinococcus sedimenti TaxID=1867090 RepID=A0ABQ2RYB6_9DEIO|nr:hypothetical protein GCM10008960_03750 [Deinococcus sedimenti]